jgi:hypothetical protein
MSDVTDATHSPNPPAPGGDETVVHPTRIEPDTPPRSGVPVHPTAALLLVAVDSLWNLADWTVVSWAVTVPCSFATVFLPTLMIQRLLKRDGWGRALLYAVLLGGLAAIPTSIFGTPVGLALLAWTGLDRLLGRRGKGR